MKKFIAKPILLAISFVLFFGVFAPSHGKIILKGASVVTDQHPMGNAGNLFKEELAKLTDQIEVQWFPTGQLGGEVQILNQVQQGVIQFCTISCAVAGTINPKVMTMYTPYLMPDWDTFLNKWVGSEGAKLIHQAMLKQGIGGYGWVPYGFNALAYVDPPIRNLDECKGRKMRSAESATILGTLQALGINAMPLPFSEVYQALQQKVVEGLTAPPALAMRSRFDEVINDVTLSDHLFGTHVFWFNQAALKQMPPDLQQKVIKAIELACAREQADVQKVDEDAIAQMKGKGIRVWTLTPEEKRRWMNACYKVVREHEKRIDAFSRDGREFMRTVYKSLGRDYDKEVLGQ